MSSADDNLPSGMADVQSRMTHEDVRYFHEHVAPRMCAQFSRFKDENFISHSPRSAFPEFLHLKVGSNDFYESGLFRHWGQDHQTMLEKKGMRFAQAEPRNFLLKYLVRIHQEQGDDVLEREVKARATAINEQERGDQAKLHFMLATAKKVEAIKADLGIVKMFTAKAKFESIENELRAKNMSPYEVIEKPGEVKRHSEEALQKINGGQAIPVLKF